MAKLIFSGAELLINGHAHTGLPMLIDRSLVVVWPVTRYLRYEATKAGLQPLSVYRYAIALKQLYTFLEAKNLGLEDISDDLLEEFGNLICASSSPDDANVKISVIARFLLWGQCRGYFANLIGVTDIGRKRIFPVSITCEDYDYHAGEPRGKFSPTVYFAGGGHFRDKDLLTDREVDAIYDGIEASNHPRTQEIQERNVLIVLCARQPALRREEICNSLKVTDLPTEASVRQAESEGRLIPIEVEGKGRKKRRPSFHPELVRQLIEFCKYARPRLLEGFKSDMGYKEPLEIFVSCKTGQRLKPSSVTEIVTDAARRRGAKVSPHRLRALGLTEFFNAVRSDCGDDETALIKAAELAGHNDYSLTQRRYIKRNKGGALSSAGSRYMDSEGVKLLQVQLNAANQKLREATKALRAQPGHSSIE